MTEYIEVELEAKNFDTWIVVAKDKVLKMLSRKSKQGHTKMNESKGSVGSGSRRQCSDKYRKKCSNKNKIGDKEVWEEKQCLQECERTLKEDRNIL